MDYSVVTWWIMLAGAVACVLTACLRGKVSFALVGVVFVVGVIVMVPAKKQEAQVAVKAPVVQPQSTGIKKVVDGIGELFTKPAEQ